MTVKFEYMVRNVENPLIKIISLVMVGARKSKKEIERHIDAGNVAWEAACSHRLKFPDSVIEFEVSTVEQNFGVITGNIGPYVQLYCKGVFCYRIPLPENSETFGNLTKIVGEFYKRENIGEIIDGWLEKNYLVKLLPEQGEQKMWTQQETDLFVISESKVWSLDNGECVSSVIKLDKNYMFSYKRVNYDESTLEVDSQANEKEVLVTEYLKDKSDNINVEFMQICEIKEIQIEQLKELEMLYRDGRSSLPDKVFDHIMETCGCTEGRLQEICGEIESGKHYNSIGVDSSKSNPVISGNCKYPAESKILSQDKVRDLQKLTDIVNCWNGKAVISWKLDGCAVRLHYKGPSFVRAESKGRARDVTNLVKNIEGIPFEIEQGLPFKEDWFKDKEWFVTGELVTENGRRSTSAGYLLRKDVDSRETLAIAKSLKFVVYDSDIFKHVSENPRVSPMRLYSQMIAALKVEAGFKTVDLCEFKCAERIMSEDMFKDLPPYSEFDVDGLVIRLNDIKKYVSLGETSHHPKGSVAFKFEDEWKSVKPDCIYGKYGSNNVLKLIAEFRPVRFGDKTVKSAVWQPKSDNYSLDYYHIRKDGYKVLYKNKPFEEYFNVDRIEVCLRGCVIPQWRLIEQ